MIPVSGICRSRGCAITASYDVANVRHVVQHGDNPEHVTFIYDQDIFDLQRPAGMSWDAVWWCYITSKLIRWANEIHRYEAARQPDEPTATARGRT